MKVYEFKLEMYLEDVNVYFSNTYSTYENAVNEGILCLKDHLEFELNREPTEEDLKKASYSLQIIEIPNLEYAENFDIKLSPVEKYLEQNIKPTHIVYDIDYQGNIIFQIIQFRIKQRDGLSNICMKYPEDFQEEAGTHFKVGDIVTTYKSKINKNKLGVVRFVPIKVKDQPYFNNDYGVTSIYDNSIQTYAIDEREIKKYEGTIKEDSDIRLLQKIITKEITISEDTWEKLRKGKIKLKDIDSFALNKVK